MNRKRVFARLAAFLLIAVFMLVTQAVLSQESADDLYLAALLKKEAEGDLNAAVQLFQKIAATYAQNRAIAAKAELQIGLCYEKLGLTQARDAFQQVVEKYPEQTDTVAAARERLSVLGRAQTLIEKGDSGLRIRKVPELIEGRISRDERWLCGMDDTGDLFVMETRTGSKRRLTQNPLVEKGDFGFDITISADSKHVGYVWWSNDRPRDLKIINMDGTGERTLRSDTETWMQLYDWTPDGHYLLGITKKRNEPGQFVLFSASDGAVQVIKNLAYISNRESDGSQATALCILSPDTGEYRAVFPQLEGMSRISWFGDGGSVLAIGGAGIRPTTGGRLVGMGTICLINVRTAGVRTLFEYDGTGTPRGTPDGKKVLYTKNSPQEKASRIISYDIASGQKEEIYRSSGRIAQMDISPDGKLLAFFDATDSSFKIIPAEGGEPRLLYRLESGIIGSFSWSPDGKYFYFFGRIQGRAGLWRIPSAGGESVRFDLAANGIMSNFDIHPDGRRIVFDSQRSGQDVWVMENFLPKR